MTWIPCTMCNCAPCVCIRTTPVYPTPWAEGWAAGAVTLKPWSLLTDEDIERIAKRVVELLKESDASTP